jgi:hypothetical protein
MDHSRQHTRRNRRHPSRFFLPIKHRCARGTNSPAPAPILRRAACRMAREILDLAGRSVRVGMSTDEIDQLVHEETVKRGAYPSPLNYFGFPKRWPPISSSAAAAAAPPLPPLRRGRPCSAARRDETVESERERR